MTTALSLLGCASIAEAEVRFRKFVETVLDDHLRKTQTEMLEDDVDPDAILDALQFMELRTDAAIEDAVTQFRRLASGCVDLEQPSCENANLGGNSQ